MLYAVAAVLIWMFLTPSLENEDPLLRLGGARAVGQPHHTAYETVGKLLDLRDVMDRSGLTGFEPLPRPWDQPA